MSDGQVEQLPWDPAAPHPLGRNIRHDPRSRAFAAPRRAEPVKDKRHRTWGARLDQLNVGACTGFTGAALLNTEPARRLVAPAPTLKASHALDFYRYATANDPWEGTWEPDDTGSSGLAVAKAMTAAGHISRYEHAFGFAHGLDVISTRPLMQGTWWTEGMFTPDASGRVHPTGGDAGGHEYLWVGVELRSKLTRADNRSWFVNSWSADWGVNGLFWMLWSDHEELLARDGDLIAVA